MAEPQVRPGEAAPSRGGGSHSTPLPAAPTTVPKPSAPSASGPGGAGGSAPGKPSPPPGGGAGYVTDAAGLQSAASGFDTAVDATRKALRILRDTLSGVGEPWGSDGLGKGFAEDGKAGDGVPGYKSQRDGTFAQISTIADRFDDIAKSLRSVAGNYGGVEQHAARQGTAMGAER